MDHKKAAKNLHETVLRGKRPADNVKWGKPDAGNGSWNIQLMQVAAMYYFFLSVKAREWLMERLKGELTPGGGLGFMGKEGFSGIYGKWIVAAIIAVSKAAQRDRDYDLHNLAQAWLVAFFACQSWVAQPKPRPDLKHVLKLPVIPMAGYRTYPGSVSDELTARMWAIAMGVDPWNWKGDKHRIRQLRNKAWMWPAHVMIETGWRLPRQRRDLCLDVTFGKTPANALLDVIPHGLFVRGGMTLARGQGCTFSYLHNNVNSNTAPVMAAIACGGIFRTHFPHGKKRPVRPQAGSGKWRRSEGQISTWAERTDKWEFTGVPSGEYDVLEL
jgi:hypothetical protein